MRILLVEDDAALAGAVCALPERQGLRGRRRRPARAEARGALLSARVRAPCCSTCICDDGEGLSLLPAMRALRDRPIVIVLTARDQVTDRIRGLDAGADDYLIKPYDPAELLARLRAVRAPRAAAPARRCCSSARCEIDLARDMVRRRRHAGGADAEGMGAAARDGDAARAHPHARRRCRMRSTASSDEADSNTLEVFVSRLRRKLGREPHPDPARPGLPAGVLARTTTA